jgi:hypothetical protein
MCNKIIIKLLIKSSWSIILKTHLGCLLHRWQLICLSLHLLSCLHLHDIRHIFILIYKINLIRTYLSRCCWNSIRNHQFSLQVSLFELYLVVVATIAAYTAVARQPTSFAPFARIGLYDKFQFLIFVYRLSPTRDYGTES